MSNETKTTSHKPAFYAYTVKDRDGKDAIWTKIGAAFPTRTAKASRCNSKPCRSATS